MPCTLHARTMCTLYEPSRVLCARAARTARTCRAHCAVRTHRAHCTYTARALYAHTVRTVRTHRAHARAHCTHAPSALYARTERTVRTCTNIKCPVLGLGSCSGFEGRADSLRDFGARSVPGKGLLIACSCDSTPCLSGANSSVVRSCGACCSASLRAFVRGV